jgi:hypothetical protein
MPINPKARSTLFCVLLYPDDPDHAQAISMLTGGQCMAVGCMHDSDPETDGNENTIVDPTTGEIQLKKPHFHFVLRFQSQRSAQVVADELGISTNYLEVSRSFPVAVSYLLHRGWPNKHQYQESDLVGSLKDKAIEALHRSSGDGSQVLSVINMIADYPGRLTITRLVIMAARSGLWGVLRGGGTWFTKIVDEHNSGIEEACTPVAMESLSSKEVICDEKGS